MKKIFLFIFSGFFSFFLFAQEQITITTYYPSPEGVYRNLMVRQRMAIGDVNRDGRFDENDLPLDINGNPIYGALAVNNRFFVGAAKRKVGRVMFGGLKVFFNGTKLAKDRSFILHPGGEGGEGGRMYFQENYFDNDPTTRDVAFIIEKVDGSKKIEGGLVFGFATSKLKRKRSYARIGQPNWAVRRHLGMSLRLYTFHEFRNPRKFAYEPRVGINVKDPKNPLEVQGVTGGIVPPRVNTTIRDRMVNYHKSNSELEGAIIYNTDTKRLEVYSDGNWQSISQE